MRREEQSTSRTLLERLRDPSDQVAWERFHTLYAPLLEGFALARGLSRDDAEELRDDCLALVVRKLPEFEYDPSRGGFKSWLYRIAAGRAVDLLRRPPARRAETVELAGLRDPHPAPDEAWDEVWRKEHLRFALQEASKRLSERTQQVFAMLLLGGRSVEEVCDLMGMNANQVYKAKGRALRAVRETLERLGADVRLV